MRRAALITAELLAYCAVSALFWWAATGGVLP